MCFSIMQAFSEFFFLPCSMTPNSKNFPTWWLLTLAGAIFLGIGAYAFIDPLSSYMKLVKFTGIGLLINGVLLLVLTATNTKYPQEKIWMQAESIIHLLFGILFLLNPLLSFIALPYFIGCWVFLVGVIKIIAALVLKGSIRGWAFILGVGMLCVILGFMLLYIPFVKASDVTILIGVFGLIMGSLYVIDAFRYRKMKDTLDMLL
jgi:uncharacterized membrane protein HdeD (DUF308 family)